MEDDTRRNLCNCGFPVHYEAVDGKVQLVCSHCDRTYPLTPQKPPPIDTGNFDDIDIKLLKHVSFVPYCSPVELCNVVPDISYSTVVRRMRKHIKNGLIHGRRKAARWFYYGTERLQELADVEGWNKK